jgi:hypothetical protein
MTSEPGQHVELESGAITSAVVSFIFNCAKIGSDKNVRFNW